MPLKVYFQHGLAKLELAVARGKRSWDKRQALAEKDAKRETERALRSRNRGED
ncbi:SsrA-binding protein [compost metagenome]